ncbi:MAG: helix-turn-helix transcriptional regulator [Lachnospiraceae bacterium]|nr:helix-turn-helix transcriptional regulator [Lachnospiraceae bacterium]
MNFNEILVMERKKRGLSQEELAEKVQVSRQSVSKWELGDAMPDLNKLLILADVLEISLDELCGREACTIKTDAVKETVKAKKRPYMMALAVIIILVYAIGLIHTINKNKEERLFYEKQFDTFTENFKVTGAEFFGQTNKSLNYRFVPSISGEWLTYKITFTDTEGNSYVFDAENNGGICAGTATLGDNYGGYNVSVSVVSGELSRNVAVAYNLCFNDNSSSWTPVNE